MSTKKSDLKDKGQADKGQIVKVSTSIRSCIYILMPVEVVGMPDVTIVAERWSSREELAMGIEKWCMWVQVGACPARFHVCMMESEGLSGSMDEASHDLVKAILCNGEVQQKIKEAINRAKRGIWEEFDAHMSADWNSALDQPSKTKPTTLS